MEFLVYAGYGLGIFLALILIYLIVVVFFPGFDVPEQPLEGSSDTVIKEASPCRSDISFIVEGETIRGWLYKPDDDNAPFPTIVMTHGAGGTKDMLLEEYALRYVDNGMAVLVVDYRNFGTSDGEPRQLFLISRQLDDLHAAIDYLRSLDFIDSDRIGLWGTSASGGYGIMAAALDRKIKCAIAQVPALDSHEDGQLAVRREGVKHFLKLFMHAQRDMGRSRFGLSAHKIPMVGMPGTLALITAPGAYEGYKSIIPKGFVNEVCARGLLRTSGYNPIDFAKRTQIHVLIQIARKDNLVSMNSHINMKAILGERAHVKEYDVDHFGIYKGSYFEKAVNDQIDFLNQYLK